MCSLCSRLRRGILYRVAERARRDQDRARPPPRRHGADAVHEHVLRRPAEGHAAQAGQRRRPPRRHPPARLRRRDRPRALGRSTGEFPIIPCNLCGSQEQPAARADQADAARLGARVPGPHRQHASTRWARVVPSHLMDRNLFPFATLQADRRGRRRGRQGVRRRRRAAPRRRPGSRRTACATATPSRRRRRRTMHMTHDPRRLVAGAAAGGCASLQHARHRRLQLQPLAGRPHARAPTPSSACRRSRRSPQQQQMLEDAARRAIEAAGFVAAPAGGAAPTSRCRSARASPLRRSPCDDPFWYGGYGAWLPAVRLRPLRPRRTGARTGGPYWGSALRLLAVLATTTTALRARGRGADPRQSDGRAAVRGARQQRRLRRAAPTSVLPAMFERRAEGLSRPAADQPAPGHASTDAEAACARRRSAVALRPHGGVARQRAQVVLPALELLRAPSLPLLGRGAVVQRARPARSCSRDSRSW